jgi:lactate permease
VQWAVSNFHGPWLVDIVAALVSMLALVALLTMWRPVASDVGMRTAPIGMPVHESQAVPSHRPLRASLPWIMLALLVAVWKVKPVEAGLKSSADWTFTIPALDKTVEKMPPTVPPRIADIPDPPKLERFEKGTYDFHLLATTGTALLLAALLSALALGIRPAAFMRLYWQAILRVRISLLTIALMLALGFTTPYCGSDTTMGLAFAATGSWFPFFSPLLGWLGVALTGSDTSSNVLVGNLQKVTAEHTGIPQSSRARRTAPGE